MFWKFNHLASSHIDSLLDKENVTLRELMDEEDILQECKAQNRKLIDFLITSANMEDMVKLITVEPPDDMEEVLRFKYPNTACELLTSDVSQINDKLAGDEGLVDKLYAFLDGKKPLNPLLASFFSKVMGLLITRKSEMIFEYLKAKEDFVGSLLHHIGTSAVMDLLLRLITCIESTEIRRAVIVWLNEKKIVEKLVDSIVKKKDEDIHCNAAQSLCDIVRLGREQYNQQQDTSDPDPLLVTMEKEETVAQLLSNMFDSDKDESVLINGLCVIHTLLEVRKGSEVSELMPNGDADRIAQGINNVIAAIIPRLKDFHNLLVNPPKQYYSTMPTSVGVFDPPLGNTRLQVAKLVTALVGSNMHQVNCELASLGTINTLLDLYFQYVWNNFLHTQVEQCLLIILNNSPVIIDGKHEHPLLIQLFSDYKFIDRLLEEWDNNDKAQAVPNGRRRGFMGHLTKMANSIRNLLHKDEDTTSLVKEQYQKLSQETQDKWEAFVGGSLTELNKKNTIELMRGYPLASSSEDDDADFKDIPFPQDTAMQQLQQMTSNFIDQFGFNDEEFAEQDEKLDANFSERTSSIEADMQVNDSNQTSAALFEQLCNERIQQFDNDDSDEDIWEEKPITFDKNAQQARSERLQGEATRCHSSDEDSTDSGEEIDSPVRIVQQPPTEGMDVDHSENPWAADSSSQAEPVAMDTTVPWEKPTKVNGVAPDEGWADFSSSPTQSGQEDSNWADFTAFNNNNSRNAQGPRSSSPVEMDTTENSRGSAYIVSGSIEAASHEDNALSTSTSDTNTDTGASSSSVLVQVSTNVGGAEAENDQQPDSTSSRLLPDSNHSTSLPSHSSCHPSPPPLPSSSPPHLSGSSVDTLVSSSSESVQDHGSAVDAIEVGTFSDSAGEANDSSSSGNRVSSSNTFQQNTPPSASHQSDRQSIEQFKEEDLGSNFNFLTASGLMKRSPATASCPSSLPETSPSSPPPAAVPPTSLSSPPETILRDGDSSSSQDQEESELTANQKLEQARAQAKEAQDLYDAATTTTSSSSSLGNGPV